MQKNKYVKIGIIGISVLICVNSKDPGAPIVLPDDIFE